MSTMIASPRPTAARSAKSNVELIPWDPDSFEHVERLRLQRIACGWKQEMVESWRALQREGKIALQWVSSSINPYHGDILPHAFQVFTDSDPEKEEKLSKHMLSYPSELLPLLDSADSFGGKPWNASGKKFIPVGHISLDHEYEKAGVAENGAGIYWVAKFYISRGLQSYGLGRAAMDAVENMAISEPLYAKTLALSTAANEYKGKAEKWEAMGRLAPSLSLQDWYSRRGFEAYKQVDEMWWEEDPSGKMWPCTAVFMKKNIVSSRYL